MILWRIHFYPRKQLNDDTDFTVYIKTAVCKNLAPPNTDIIIFIYRGYCLKALEHELAEHAGDFQNDLGLAS